MLATVRHRSGDGVRWAALESVTDPARVGDVVAAATGVLVDPITGPRRALIRALIRGRALVLCRTPRRWTSSWTVPAPDAPNAAAVQTVCRRLDGVPLAIELAATWVGMLTPAQISRALDDRFRLLVRGPRGVVPRQQSLAASVEWSHDLLGDDARVLVRRLARFSGGFTLAAAEAVCPAEPLGEVDVRGALHRLVDASMCQVGGLIRRRTAQCDSRLTADPLEPTRKSRSAPVSACMTWST